MADHPTASVADGLDQTPRQRRGTLGGLVDAAFARAMTAVVGDRLEGHLDLRLPSGRCVRLGRSGPLEAILEIKCRRAVARTLRRGLLGFAESYMAGDVDTPSLPDLIEYFLVNEAALSAAVPTLLRSSRGDRRYHTQRANTIAGSRRNIAAHYDLGNAFYRLWLDRSLSYSSAIYSRPGMTLEEAQAEKHDRILAALELAPGHRLLEIGCGWGSVVATVAAAGADVTAITISREQLQETNERIARVGLAHRARALFQDYRDSTGCYDRLVSIEMIEAVGEENWPAYFATLADRLLPGGVGVVQAITIREDLYDSYRSRPDFIQRYIFPGGMLPTVPMMAGHAAGAGLTFETVETFGASYALTLAEWRRRFHAAWPEIEALGFDARFRRMWDYYLCYCEAGFRHGLVDVGLYRMRKHGSSGASETCHAA